MRTVASSRLPAPRSSTGRQQQRKLLACRTTRHHTSNTTRTRPEVHFAGLVRSASAPIVTPERRIEKPLTRAAEEALCVRWVGPGVLIDSRSTRGPRSMPFTARRSMSSASTYRHNSSRQRTSVTRSAASLEYPRSPTPPRFNAALSPAHHNPGRSTAHYASLRSPVNKRKGVPA